MDWDNPEWSEPTTPPAKRGGPRGAMPRRGFAPFKHAHQEARKVDDNERRFGLRDWEGSRRRAAPSRGAGRGRAGPGAAAGGAGPRFPRACRDRFSREAPPLVPASWPTAPLSRLVSSLGRRRAPLSPFGAHAWPWGLSAGGALSVQSHAGPRRQCKEEHVRISLMVPAFITW